MQNENGQKRSTIIITDKYSHETKIFNIKQKHIENFGLYKKIFFGTVAFIVLLLGGLISYIGYERYQAKKSSQELAALKNNLDDAITKEALSNRKVQQMWKNLNRADSSLQKIERYLSNRNVKSFTVAPKGNTANVGGEYYPSDEVNPDLIQQRADEISDVLQTIQVVPIGLPHQGSFTSFFGERENPFGGGGGEFHPGLDISGSIGDPIHATANGTVIFCGWRGGYGNCVMLKHGYGYETLYGHMSRILVHEGESIKAGNVVGLLGTTGRSNGPHIHYEVIFNNEKQNPIKFLNIN